MPSRAIWFVRAFVVALISLSGCLFDSQYLQQKSAQKNVAQQRTPRTLQATPVEGKNEPGPGRSRARALRLRAHATPSYAAEVVDWPRQFARLVEDVNRILEPTLDVRFEVVDARNWSTTSLTDSLDPLLNELRSVDRGDDVDCVVGLVGSLPVLAHSFHQLGFGQVMGKHLVVRAMNDAREREAIEIELSRLGADEREALYQTRKRHKATAVFLHEVGHNLGLIHATDAASIMSTRYDKSMSAFSSASAEVMRMTLEHRSEQQKNEGEPAFAERLLGRFDHTRANWVPAEREAMVTSLKLLLASPAARTASSGDPTSARAADELALRDVASADRAVFAAAVEDERGGRRRDAWAKAEPLFARYPDVYAVQDLRCRLALALSSAWEEARHECERLMDISRGKPRQKTR